METAVAHGDTARWQDRSTATATAPASGLVARLLAFSRSTTFGNVVIVMFFVSQALDGALTYIGLRTFGPHIEGNPLLAWLMASIGEGPALTGAKLAAVGFGMILHLASVHRIVALLTTLYICAALIPWTILLLIAGRFA